MRFFDKPNSLQTVGLVLVLTLSANGFLLYRRYTSSATDSTVSGEAEEPVAGARHIMGAIDLNTGGPKRIEERSYFEDFAPGSHESTR